MSIALLMQQLRDAGAPVEAIMIAVAAVEAERSKFEAAEEARKTAQRERTAKHRSMSRDRNVTVTTQQRDGDVTPQSSPTPPKTTPEDNSPSDPKGSSAPQGARQPRKPRNRPLPDDWQPGPMSEAARIKLERSGDWMRDTAEEMRCWAKGGGHLRTDWDEVHCGWMRREAKRETQLPRARNGPPARPPSAQERAMQLAKQANLALMGDPDDPGPFADDAAARPADGGYSNGHARSGFHEPAGGQFRLAPPRPPGPPRPH